MLEVSEARRASVRARMMWAKRRRSSKVSQALAREVSQVGDAHTCVLAVLLMRRAALGKSQHVWLGASGKSCRWNKNFAVDKVLRRTLEEYPCWIMRLL